MPQKFTLANSVRMSMKITRSKESGTRDNKMSIMQLIVSIFPAIVVKASEQWVRLFIKYTDIILKDNMKFA